ncbi:MAG: SIMPL domain-containing protein [Candidatus Paceibacterota bacterium]|jgi:hypothetical protein
MEKIQKFFMEKPIVSGSIILAIGLVIATVIGAYTFVTIRSFDNGLVVTGSAKTTVQSDSVKWTSNITRTVTEGNLPDGYALMARDAASVKDFMTRNGIAADELEVSPIFVDQVYKYNDQNGPREYNLRQTVIVASKDLTKVANLAKNTQELINKGIVFSTQAPEYYYSKLADLRVSLLGDAIKDARARAEQLARSSGSSVGSLKSASTGVVQVLSPNSVEVADYGQYDTSSITKDVMITVRATFVVK